MDMDIRELITTDPEIMAGQAVFKGSRVPVETLFDYLEAGAPLAEFLDEFPTVSKEQAVGLLEWTNTLLKTKNPEQLYTAVA